MNERDNAKRIMIMHIREGQVEGNGQYKWHSKLPVANMDKGRSFL